MYTQYGTEAEHLKAIEEGEKAGLIEVARLSDTDFIAYCAKMVEAVGYKPDNYLTWSDERIAYHAAMTIERHGDEFPDPTGVYNDYMSYCPPSSTLTCAQSVARWSNIHRRALEFIKTK